MNELNKVGVYEFGDFRLNARCRQLYRRRSGEPVPLTPRAVLLLITLVCGDGRLLTKEELLDRVWAGSMVEEANLSQTIFVLRKTLGDDPRHPRYILTVPARGYQFIAVVGEVESEGGLDLNSFHRFERQAVVNTRAYRSYVQGRAFWNKRTGESLRSAIAHFEEALRVEPNFALACAGLADSHHLLAEYYAAALPAEVRTSMKAGSAGPDTYLAEAYTTLAYAQAFYDWDWAGAETSFIAALKLDPDNATANHWYGDYLCVVGRFDEARRHIDRAIELKPYSPAIATALAGYFYTRRDAANLIKQAKHIIDLAPGFAYGHFYLGFGYQFAGLEEKAVETFAVAATAFGEPPECGEELRSAYAQNGMTGVWHKRLEQYETRPHLKDYPPYLKSLVPIRLGDKETTLAWLNQALEQRDRGIVYAKYEPLLEPLRADPRFQDLIARLDL